MLGHPKTVLVKFISELLNLLVPVDDNVFEYSKVFIHFIKVVDLNLIGIVVNVLSACLLTFLYFTLSQLSLKQGNTVLTILLFTQLCLIYLQVIPRAMRICSF